MTVYDQANRILAITTQLGANEAVLTEVEGTDAISRPFEIRIRFATEQTASSVENLLGKPLTLFFGRPGDTDVGQTGIERRPFHGILRSLARARATRGEATEWRGVVVPKLWFLSRATDCRIFQEKTVPEIVEAILGEHGVTFRNALTASYTPLTYCVQYRETTLAFISRIMEQAGIAYWHEHTDSAHTMVLADANNTATLASWPALPIRAHQDSGAIRSLDDEHVVRSGNWALRDFNFETPSNNLHVEQPTRIATAKIGEQELYDYPGLYPDSGAGRAVAGLQIAQEEAQHRVLHGEGGVSGLTAGMRIKVADLEDLELLVTEVHHMAQDYSHWSADMWGDREIMAARYDNRFACIPKDVRYLPPRVTPKTYVHGPQTAIVTGPSGEEIYTDQYGRVKVHFHWDRVNALSETSSCWVRVSQGWAGVGWGQIHIPRIGQEVIVDFLEGDPDRPIITGRVYNAESTVPYALPDNKTQSGIKSRSSPQGGTSNFNEMRLEDKKGSEEIYIQAEKDMNLLVKNARTETINEGDFNGDDTYLLRKGNKVATVGEGNYNLTVSKGNRTVEIGEGDHELTVKQGNLTVEVTQGDETRAIKTGNHELTIDQGDQKTKCSLGSVTIEAMQKITLKVGSNSIEISQSGVTVKGIQVKVEGTAQASLEAPMTQVKGSGMVQISGGLIMVG